MSLECLILFGGDLRDCKGEGLNTRFVSASNIESLARRWLKLEPRAKKRNEREKKGGSYTEVEEINRTILMKVRKILK